MDVHQEMAADGENFGSLDADGENFGSLDADEPELVSSNENEAASDEAFLTLMKHLGCSDRSLEAMVLNKVTSSTMLALCKAPDGHLTMSSELYIDMGLVRAAITSRIRDWEMMSSAQSGESYDSFSSVSKANEIRMSKEAFPTIPRHADGSVLPSVTAFREYGVAIEGWLDLVGAQHLAELCKFLFKTPKEFKKHSGSIELTTALDQMCDKRWANQILCKASPEVKRMLSRPEQINWHGARSGAMMVATMGSVILNRTVHQDGLALEHFLAWPPVAKAELFQQAMIKFDDELDRLKDSGLELTFMIRSHSLGNMTSVVRRQERHKFDIAIKWALIPRDETHEEIYNLRRECIDQCIMDYPTRLTMQPGISAPFADHTGWVCFGWREYGVCSKLKRGQKCKFLHTKEGPALAECTDAAYLRTNECSNNHKCLFRHPNDRKTQAANPANKKETTMMMAEINPQSSLAQSRAIRSNFGQDNREHYLNTTDYDDRLIEDVHPSELFAALEESVSSSVSGSEDSGIDNWETASEGASGIDDDQESTENVWGNDDGAFVPDRPNMEDTPELSLKIDSEICGTSESPDCTDDSEVTLTDVSTGFEQESDGEEDIDAIFERELLEVEMANVTLYTPPATRQSDYERDELEQSIETMEPRRLFQAGYREDGLDATTDGTTTMTRTDEDADASKTNEDSTPEPVPDDQMHADVCMPATWDSSGDYGATELNNAPTNMTLIDSGTSRHMLGSEGIKYAANVREADQPIQLETAAGPMELGLEGDALLRNGSVLRNCLLNDQTELNLLSEGLMRTESDWTFNSIERGLKSIGTPDGDENVAHREGVLDYLPYDLEMVQWPPHPNGCQEISTVHVAAAACSKHKKFDQVQHEKQGHWPKCHGCDVCERAFMQRMGAFKGGLDRSSQRKMKTLNLDLLDWAVLDNNGHRYSLTGVVLGSAFPAIRQQRNKTGVVTAANIRSMKVEIETASDLGGSKGYKIERIHKDQGSEFKSAHLDDCGEMQVLSTTGEEGQHTDCSAVEGLNKIIEYVCTAIGLTSLETAELSLRCHGELSNHAVDLIRLRSRTNFQKDAGISCWREQTLTDADATIQNTYRWGSLAYGFVKKEDRENKLSERAYRAIFAGWDKEILGAARLIPFEVIADGEVVLYKTKVTKTFKVFDGNYPLKSTCNDPYPACECEWVDGDELELAVAADADSVGTEYEVEKIIDKNVAADGSWVQYLCRFVGFGPEHDLWFDEPALECRRLIEQYESEISQELSLKSPLEVEEASPEIVAASKATRADNGDGATLYGAIDRSRIEEGEFEARIAFSKLHECDPALVTDKVLKGASCGAAGYRKLWDLLAEEADGDWNWIMKTLQQRGPLPACHTNAYPKNYFHPELSTKSPFEYPLPSIDLTAYDKISECIHAAFAATVVDSSNPSMRQHPYSNTTAAAAEPVAICKLPKANSGAKRNEVSSKEATRPEFFEKTKCAIDRELREMAKKAFIMDDAIPTQAEMDGALEGRMVLTIKDADSFNWFMKARLVAKDLKCKRWCDPAESYAAVPSLKAFRLLMAASGTKFVSTCDLVTAYLQQDKFKDGKCIWLKFYNPITKQVEYKKLSKFIYGCQEAGQKWSDCFREWMLSLGFTELKNAGSMYVLDCDAPAEEATIAARPAGLTGKIVVSCYVDDPAIVCDNQEAEAWYHTALDNRFDVKHHSYLTVSNPIEYCGTRMTKPVDGGLKIDNRRFIERLLDARGMQDCNAAKNPVTKATLLHLHKNADNKLSAELATVARSTMGELHWLAATTHPKLAVAHSMLAKYSANPCEGLLEALKTAIRYAAGAVDDCLFIPAGINSGLECFTDSDWAGNYSIDGCTKSRSGMLIRYNGVPVDWLSSKQLCIATSSADAESRALSTGVMRGLQMQYIAEELMLQTSSVLPVFVDAEAAIGFARNNGGGSKMKHIDIREQWVQSIRDKKQIKITKVPGKKNPADFFTKLMTNAEFIRTSQGLSAKL